ncbi:conserved hypothetical protein [Streptomyces himastatinicus ATCC 53653]|uniref:Uncharacterized protein n=1 Tax=Streptomyces himastatinicus ATCC 53653 TaxID=457427 RepID=D9WW04_9ACTN|nr:hypothetical protein [Streptomyces himastatinicus]EFL24513.1 conserved hypothetical protein [Streptomyces himastatinicus ATCC 53653]
MATGITGVHLAGAAEGDGRQRTVLGPVATVGFPLAMVGALVMALRLPVGTTVFGLALFGILHNVTELRYVLGRFDAVLAGPFLRLLLLLTSGIVLCRLLPAGELPRTAEILLAYGLLGAACVHGLRGRRGLCVGAGGVLVCAAACSLAYPDYHFVVLAHLHNVVPLLFLWEWSRGLERGRRLFRAVQCGWVVAVPGLLLAGAFDGLLAPGTAWADRLSAAYTPPAWLDSAVALRFLALFAFLQTMHYVVWVWFLPRYAPEATASFERRVPLLHGWRVWALGLAGGAALAALFASDYASGKQLYAAIATYHAYLEFPVLLMLVLGLGTGPASLSASPSPSTSAPV